MDDDTKSIDNTSPDDRRASSKLVCKITSSKCALWRISVLSDLGTSAYEECTSGKNGSDERVARASKSIDISAFDQAFEDCCSCDTVDVAGIVAKKDALTLVNLVLLERAYIPPKALQRNQQTRQRKREDSRKRAEQVGLDSDGSLDVGSTIDIHSM